MAAWVPCRLRAASYFYGQFVSTLAGIEANDTQGADVTGGPTTTIMASSGGLIVDVTGTLITGDGSAKGIGIGLTVGDIRPPTAAFVGGDPTGNPKKTPAAASTLELGKRPISATTGPATFTDGTTQNGVIIGISVAGVPKSSGTLGQSPDDPTKKISSFRRISASPPAPPAAASPALRRSRSSMTRRSLTSTPPGR